VVSWCLHGAQYARTGEVGRLLSTPSRSRSPCTIHPGAGPNGLGRAGVAIPSKSKGVSNIGGLNRLSPELRRPETARSGASRVWRGEAKRKRPYRVPPVLRLVLLGKGGQSLRLQWDTCICARSPNLAPAIPIEVCISALILRDLQVHVLWYNPVQTP
jgi:hypothetical protein